MTASARVRSARPEQRGVILVLSALLVLVLMGTAAVVVDLGIARVTQLQLQASADAASIEGLRGRDADIPDPVARDTARRTEAALAAALVFDEDADLATGASDYLLGAGPTLSTGVGGLDDPEGGLLVGSAPYRPRLQLNAASNRPEGDLVAGAYTAVDSADRARNDWHGEAGDYTRLDFTPGASAQAPSFLARTRRTRDAQGVDNVPGVSSAGPTLPYLFGLGSGVLSAPTPDVYDPRRDGITVRATSIADARPAVAAGIALGTVPGLAPVALDALDPSQRRWLTFQVTEWSALPANSPILVDVLPDGSAIGVAGGPSEALLGAAASVPGIDGGRVGDLALQGPIADFGSSGAPPTGLFFVGLHTVESSGALRLLSFAAVRIASAEFVSGSGGVAVLRLRGTKSASIVAPANATASLSVLPDPAVLADPDFLAPLPAGAEPLLAPVLAR